MNLLITGASGFIGRNLCEFFIDKNINFIALVRETTNIDFFKEKKIKYFVFDGKIQKLSSFIIEKKITGVVHLSTYFVSSHNENDILPLINSNILFSLSILEACKNSNIKWFINTGTFWQHYKGYEYNPVNLYAATKQSFEALMKYYDEVTNIKFTTLKINDTYGDGDTRKKIFHLWKENLKSKSLLKMSPGNQLIDIVHVDKVVKAFFKLINILEREKNIHNSYFISSGEKITLKDLAKKFENTHGLKLNIEWGALPYREREVMKPACKGKELK